MSGVVFAEADEVEPGVLGHTHGFKQVANRLRSAPIAAVAIRGLLPNE